ncbi:unknown [Ruminococcus sp. CAG:382]|nr:unknown [Ruminococcus sp. CAG:382]
MKFSLFDLRSEASSTISRILATVDSPYSLVVRTLMTSLWLMQPETTSSPAFASRGALSPVSATVLSVDVPSMITPSSGMRSPGRTTTVSPTFTSEGATVIVLPPRSTFALSGRMSMSSDTERLLLSSASSSNNSPTWKNSMTNTASANIGSESGRKPITSAPTVAIVMRNSSPKTSPSVIPSNASIMTS